jgi:transposase
MVAEVGDITRFANARKLASWAGLTPTVRGSDLTVRHGHSPGQGSPWLLWVLNQAAQTAKRSPEFSATYTAISRRRGKKIATVRGSRPSRVPSRGSTPAKKPSEAAWYMPRVNRAMNSG